MSVANVPNKHKNRLGKIRVVDHEASLSVIPGMFAQLDFIPVSVSFWDNNVILVYVGYSPRFDELGEGEIIPEYDVTIREADSSFVVETVNRRNT